MKTLKILLLSFALTLGAVAITIYSGFVNVAADEPHSDLVYLLLEEVRINSIAKAAQSIEVPDLTDPELLLTGGADYEYMCSSCHLKPGQHESDLSLGLYPQPPNLAISSQTDAANDTEKFETTARNNFWVIKHGIKASGMPAWGKTHDDQRIWAMVAFLNQLPDLTPMQYQVLTAVD